MIGSISLVLSIAVVAGVVTRVVSVQRRRTTLAASMAGDSSLQLMPSSGTVIFVRAQQGERTIEARSRAVERSTWFLSSSLPRVAARGALLCERHGAGQQLQELVGVHDIRTNDVDVDRLVRIRGGDPDMTRGLVSVPEVLKALRVFFLEQDGARLEVANSGAVYLALAHRGTSAEHIRAVVRDAGALLDVLDHHADAPPRAAERHALTGGVGPDSGTPFGVPLGDRR